MRTRSTSPQDEVRELELFAPTEAELKLLDPATFEPLFGRLARSKFRSSFYLNARDVAYIRARGWARLERDVRLVIARRLAPAVIANDGRQTPMRHGVFPPFIAQHATGCCCRACLSKWHGIAAGCALTREEQNYVVSVVMAWLHRQVGAMLP